MKKILVQIVFGALSLNILGFAVHADDELGCVPSITYCECKTSLFVSDYRLQLTIVNGSTGQLISERDIGTAFHSEREDCLEEMRQTPVCR